MRNTAALIVTAIALAAGCFLLGYGYCRWWQEQARVTVEGFVWRYDNSYTVRQDAYYDRTPKPHVAFEVLPLAEHFADWPLAGTIRVSYYRERLPARSANIGLEDLVEISPAFTSLLVRVDPLAAGSRDRLGMINVPAQYVIGYGTDGYAFVAANEYEAERAAKAVVWQIFQVRLDGDLQRFVGYVPRDIP